LVIGHSRLGSTAIGSEEDAARFKRVFSILFPAVEQANAKTNHVKDVMHVSTAIRYGAYGFVTREKRLLSKRAAVQAAFNDFRMWTPEQALQEVKSRVRSASELDHREPGRTQLPDWRPADDEWPESDPPS
jgi:hypothetical protein